MPITKTISFPPEEQDLYRWLMSQSNQSATVRDALRMLRDQLEGKPTADDIGALSEQLADIRRAIGELKASGVAIGSQVDEDQAAVDELMHKFGGQE